MSSRAGARPSGLPLVPLVLLLLLASAGAVGATLLAGDAVRRLVDGSLESSARNVSRAAERLLRLHEDPGAGFDRLFADRVVAYALLADASGVVRYHTNPSLEGGPLAADEPPVAFTEPGGGGRRIILGTGLPVWVSDRPVRLRDGTALLLRVALHTTEADRMLGRVRTLWAGVAVLLAFLWTAGAMVLSLEARSRRLRREFERRESLALVGQMTATLAHEIRNAIAGIKGHAQLAAERTPEADPRASSLSQVLEGVGRIETLVADLLGYAREESFELAAVDPAAVLRAAAAAVPWPGATEWSTPDGLRARADSAKLERVLVNGIRNATQAMGGSGRLRLATAARDGEVEVRIEDQGPGIPPGAAPRLFTPFFTTKAAGTGLGLAWSRKAVEGMGGTIGLENLPAGGAVLRIVLPGA